MFGKNSAIPAALLVAALGGSAAYAQQEGRGAFVTSGIEACSGDDCNSAKSEAITKADNICSPLEAKQVSSWKYRSFKAGYLFMTEVSATFTCGEKGQ